jgi:small subunit ribosomal protein S20
MANTSSAIKRTRQTERETAVNRSNASRYRTQVRKLRKALDGKDVKSAQELLRPTFSVVDKAVQKGVIKKNTASRVKSRLTIELNKLQKAGAAA